MSHCRATPPSNIRRKSPSFGYEPGITRAPRGVVAVGHVVDRSTALPLEPKDEAPSYALRLQAACRASRACTRERTAGDSTG
jgi:hypothetical protein